MEIKKISYCYFLSVTALFIFFIIRHFRLWPQCAPPATFYYAPFWGMVAYRGLIFGHIQTCLQSIFSTLFTKRQQRCGLWLRFSNSNLQLVYFAVLVVLFIEPFSGLQLGIDSRTQHLQMLTSETERLSIQ